MPKEHGEMLRGALEMLILQTLRRQAMHGYAITERIQDISEEVLKIEEGSMYPALYRMQRRGWIEASWGRSANNRRAKFYSITATGRRHLQVVTDRWNRITRAISSVMQNA